MLLKELNIQTKYLEFKKTMLASLIKDR